MKAGPLNSAVITRFAPSPTGHLHLGHAYAALFAWDLAAKAGAAAAGAAAAGGRCLLRIEDIDQGRCRPAFEAAIIEDLAWLGLRWTAPVWRQSAHLEAYQTALASLAQRGLLYPCFCTRREIEAEIAAAAGAPHLAQAGPDGPLYPGTCRGLDAAARAARIADGVPHGMRLDMARAVQAAGPLRWHDRARGWQAARPQMFGDVVLARKDAGTSYHLAVTVDDAAQGVTVVTRADDLVPATHVHRLLQALLDLPVPEWHHHRLLTDATGKRFAKRDRSLTLRDLRARGHRPDDVRAMITELARRQA